MEETFLMKQLKYDNIQKITTGLDNCITGCLLNYYYFKKNYKMIAIDVSKKQPLDADPKVINKLLLLEI